MAYASLFAARTLTKRPLECDEGVQRHPPGGAPPRTSAGTAKPVRAVISHPSSGTVSSSVPPRASRAFWIHRGPLRGASISAYSAMVYCTCSWRRQDARGRREATETLNLWSREVGCRFLEAAALARVLNRWPKGPPSRCTPAFRSESPSCGLSARRQLFGLGILKLRGRSLISLIIQTELVLLCTFRTAAGRLGNVWRL